MPRCSLGWPRPRERWISWLDDVFVLSCLCPAQSPAPACEGPPLDAFIYLANTARPHPSWLSPSPSSALPLEGAQSPPGDTAHPHAQGPARRALDALRSRTHLFATVFPGPTPRSTVGDALCPLPHPPHLSHPQWEAVPVWGAALAPHQGGLPSLGAACILTPGDGENPSFAKPDISLPLAPCHAACP